MISFKRICITFTGLLALSSAAAEEKIATFAGGCFWCMEPPYDVLPGVLSTTSGYTGGDSKNPTYKQVSAGVTGHAEVVRVVFDSSLVSYEDLLTVFWRNIDPTTKSAQFCDKGNQYRSAIFYHDEKQKTAAEQSKQALASSGIFNKPIVTEIASATEFYPAEEYHQDYYQKHPLKYKFYRHRCGRDQFLEKIWGKSK